MPPECTNNWIISIVTSVATTALGGMIGYFSARFTSDRVAYKSACAKFRAAFSPSLAFLDKAMRHGSDSDRPDSDAFLKEAFVGYAAAVEDFRPFVRAEDLGAYQQAWENYCQIAHGPKNSSAIFMATTIDRDNPWKILQDQIHDILQFAKT